MKFQQEALKPQPPAGGRGLGPCHMHSPGCQFHFIRPFCPLLFGSPMSVSFTLNLITACPSFTSAFCPLRASSVQSLTSELSSHKGCAPDAEDTSCVPQSDLHKTPFITVLPIVNCSYLLAFFLNKVYYTLDFQQK